MWLGPPAQMRVSLLSPTVGSLLFVHPPVLHETARDPSGSFRSGSYQLRKSGKMGVTGVAWAMSPFPRQFL